jgi:hypothetical protein
VREFGAIALEKGSEGNTVSKCLSSEPVLRGVGGEANCDESDLEWSLRQGSASAGSWEYPLRSTPAAPSSPEFLSRDSYLSCSSPASSMLANAASQTLDDPNTPAGQLRAL